MTFRDICDCLRNAGIENAETEASLLLGHYTFANHADILANPERNYESEALLDALDKRCEHIPLQYIFGKWDFYRETYFVNESCLIPRSDTELLVDYAVKNLPHGAYFADLCTGSGCIAISTLANRADCTALAIDLFENTLATAKKNAVQNHVEKRVTFRLANVLEKDALAKDECFDAILSNPPYIRTAVLDTLEDELFFEPRAALDGGDDGMIFYRAILQNTENRLKTGGFLLFEIGFDQKEDIRKLSSAFGYECEVHNDLSGNPRLAILKKMLP